MAKFKVVIERSLGIRGRNSEHQINPFHIRDLFNPNLKLQVERRTWADMECKNESEVRRFFAKAQDEDLAAVRGFRIVSIERTDD